MANGSPARGDGPRSDWQRLGSWLVRYPSTLMLGAAYAAIIGFRWSVPGAAALLGVFVAFAAGERWGERTEGPEAPEWPAFRWAYSGLVVIGTIIFVVATGKESYVFSLPAVALVPAVSSIGKGLRLRTERRAVEPAE